MSHWTHFSRNSRTKQGQKRNEQIHNCLTLDIKLSYTNSEAKRPSMSLKGDFSPQNSLIVFWRWLSLLLKYNGRNFPLYIILFLVSVFLWVITLVPPFSKALKLFTEYFTRNFFFSRTANTKNSFKQMSAQQAAFYFLFK